MLDKIDLDPRQLGKTRPYCLIWGAKGSENLQSLKPTQKDSRSLTTMGRLNHLAIVGLNGND